MANVVDSSFEYGNGRVLSTVSPKALEKAVVAALAVLQTGLPVALPTETVYGLAADALSREACARIFKIKRRPLSDPLIVHIPDLDWLPRLAHVDTQVLRLAERFWPGPLTLVVPKTNLVPAIVTAGQDMVAVRMSAHPVFQTIVKAFGRPLAAPSANRFGRISPTSAAHVVEELGADVSLIVDGGACGHGIESTIVLVHRDGALEVLRPGPITEAMLSTVGMVGTCDSPVGMPGSFKSHYAPATPVFFSNAEAVPTEVRGCSGLLAWAGSGAGFAAIEKLSEKQDLREAAAHLYGALRRLDAAGVERIFVEPVPEVGLGIAIMNRLRKAAAPRE